MDRNHGDTAPQGFCNDIGFWADCSAPGGRSTRAASGPSGNVGGHGVQPDLAAVSRFAGPLPGVERDDGDVPGRRDSWGHSESWPPPRRHQCPRVRYLQQIQDVHVLGPNGKPAGIHIEPGIWLSIPLTANPQDAPTVARMAGIPHGTTLVAQGSALPVINAAPPIAPASITPFTIAPPHTPVPFPETNLGIATTFRTPSADIPRVTQAMVNNPNIVLTDGLAGKNVIATTTLKVSTAPLNPPSTGGGTSNIAFLQGAAGGPNAQSVQVDATFWIETIKEATGATKLQLQYTQTVLLNFNGLSWPHVSVATLIKQ